jgi:hypothetical protein
MFFILSPFSIFFFFVFLEHWILNAGQRVLGEAPHAKFVRFAAFNYPG